MTLAEERIKLPITYMPIRILRNYARLIKPSEINDKLLNQCVTDKVPDT